METRNSGKKKEKKKKYFCDIKLRRGGCLGFSSVGQIEECCVECELSFAVVRWWCFPPPSYFIGHALQFNRNMVNVKNTVTTSLHSMVAML